AAAIPVAHDARAQAKPASTRAPALRATLFGMTPSLPGLSPVQMLMRIIPISKQTGVRCSTGPADTCPCFSAGLVALARVRSGGGASSRSGRRRQRFQPLDPARPAALEHR